MMDKGIPIHYNLANRYSYLIIDKFQLKKTLIPCGIPATIWH
jgi:hypothetical protein